MSHIQQDYNQQYPVGYQQPQHFDQHNQIQYGVIDAAPKLNTPEEERVEKLLLLITWVSIFNCVMKMDYNVALYLFLYYIWVTRTHTQHYKSHRKWSTEINILLDYFIKFLLANLVFIGLDTLWFLINMNAWAGGYEEEYAKYSVWLSFRVYRIFTLIITVFIILLKLVLAFFQYKCYSAVNPSTQAPVQPAGNLNHGMNPAGMNPAGMNPAGQQFHH